MSVERVYNHANFTARFRKRDDKIDNLSRSTKYVGRSNTRYRRLSIRAPSSPASFVPIIKRKRRGLTGGGGGFLGSRPPENENYETPDVIDCIVFGRRGIFRQKLSSVGDDYLIDIRTRI